MAQGLPSTELFRDYEITRTLGEGQYGVVWECVRKATGQVFACKQMDKLKHPKSVARERDCFLRVQSHPNIVHVEALYEDANRLFIVMELCNDGDLLPRICSSGGGMDEEETRHIFHQLVAAVDHCHSRHVIHRDLKPENVLLHASPNGTQTVKLTDFGLATYLRSSKGRKTQGWVGSPPYEAPEVIALQPYDYAADIFSLGVVLYGMLSASWPSFLKGRVLNKRIDFLAPVWGSVSDNAKKLVMSMLAEDPSARPSASELLAHPWFANELMELDGPLTPPNTETFPNPALHTGKTQEKAVGNHGLVVCPVSTEGSPTFSLVPEEWVSVKAGGTPRSNKAGAVALLRPESNVTFDFMMTNFQPLSLSRTPSANLLLPPPRAAPIDSPESSTPASPEIDSTRQLSHRWEPALLERPKALPQGAQVQQGRSPPRVHRRNPSEGRVNGTSLGKRLLQIVSGGLPTATCVRPLAG